MEQRHKLFTDSPGNEDTIASASPESQLWDSPGNDAEKWISAGLNELEQRLQQGMPQPDLDAAMGFLERTRARVDSLMCNATRAAATGPDKDPTTVLREKTRLSSREAKRMAKVADRLTELPKVAESFAAGDITLDHASALANAAEKVGPEAVESDPTLLEEANRTNSDRFARRARDWSDRILIEAGVDTLQRQRRAREGKLWVDRNSGMGMLMAKLPGPQFAHLKQAADAHYLQLLRRDSTGGRDPNAVRTPAHRMADVLFELLTNRDAHTGEPLTSNPGVRAKASTQLIITAEHGVVDGARPDGRVEIIGVGPVPPDILKTLSSDTQVAGMIFDRTGRPLWLGRNQRLANAAQRLAVAIRDGGCFKCGAPMHQCELHHIREWHRDGGRTDIDNLVAVCRQHHRWLENENVVIRRTASGRYRIRPRDGPPG